MADTAEVASAASSRDPAVGLRAERGHDRLGVAARSAVGSGRAGVRRTVEGILGPGALDKQSAGRRGSMVSGHIPFSPRAKKVLELSLREALALKQKSIADGHIL